MAKKNKDADLLNESEPKTPETVEEKVIVGSLFSRLDGNKELPYNGSFIQISPRQKIKKVNKDLLTFPLPKGIVFIEDIGG